MIADRHCACGCGQPIAPGKTFVNHHNRKGAKHSLESLQKMSKSLKGIGCGRRVERVTFTCLQCGNESKRLPCHAKRFRFCGHRCRMIYQQAIVSPPEERPARKERRRKAKIKQASLWNKANRDRRQAISKAAFNRRRLRKKASPGVDFTAADIQELYRSQSGICANFKCRALLFSGYHADHIIPICRGGSNEKSNIQLLCPTCNLRKNRKTMEEFVASL